MEHVAPAQCPSQEQDPLLDPVEVAAGALELVADGELPVELPDLVQDPSLPLYVAPVLQFPSENSADESTSKPCGGYRTKLLESGVNEFSQSICVCPPDSVLLPVQISMCCFPEL